MKKNKKTYTAWLLAGTMAASMGSLASQMPVLADASKVVSIGADLTEEEKALMLRYFGLTGDNSVQKIEVTNQDEVSHLSGYIPREQIGTRTVSCAYINPTESGGIRVKTANLQYVTANMIASTLADLGIQNCEVVSACPFQVSGTGALTGIIMAYETATGETIDDAKKQVATQEIVVTKEVAQDIGTIQAEYLIGQAKKEALNQNLSTTQEIQGVVVDLAEKNDIQITQQQAESITSLTQNIVNQDYGDTYITNITEINNNIQQEMDIVNQAGQAPEAQPDTQPDTEQAQTETGILADTDESILGQNIIVSDTEDPNRLVQSLETETQAEIQPETKSEPETWAWEEETWQTPETGSKDTEEETEPKQEPETGLMQEETAWQDGPGEAQTETAPDLTERNSEAMTETLTEAMTEAMTETATEAKEDDGELLFQTESVTEAVTEPESSQVETPADTETGTEPQSQEPPKTIFGYDYTKLNAEQAKQFMQMETYCSQNFPYSNDRMDDVEAEGDFAYALGVSDEEREVRISYVSKTLLDLVYQFEATGLTQVGQEEMPSQFKPLDEQIADALRDLASSENMSDVQAEECQRVFTEILAGTWNPDGSTENTEDLSVTDSVAGSETDAIAETGMADGAADGTAETETTFVVQ